MPATPEPQEPQSRAGGIVAKVGGQRNAAMLAAGGAVALAALYTSRKRKAAADTSGTTIQAASNTFDSGPYDMWNSWQDQYEGLAKRIGDLEQAPTPTPTPAPPPPVQIDKPPAPAPAPTPAPPAPTPAAKPQTVWYTAHTGDTYSAIASRYGHSAQDLWNYQLQDGIRPSDTQATLRQRGINNALFNGSSVAIPGSWT
ncbi:hypothetical protein [Kitasatospora sp. NPDC057198]|uniref:LysM peptidoglycan-binding domain-containing protein n=1 Tax=Kitasatospora sp. NPDC057198 TaxID=3346046 RepID=UPI00362FC0A3